MECRMLRRSSGAFRSFRVSGKYSGMRSGGGGTHQKDTGNIGNNRRAWELTGDPLTVPSLVGGILIVSSSNKAASLPCPVTVEIGGISLSSPPNLGALTRRGAGSSETEALRPVTLVGVRSLGKSSSDLGPLGKYGETVLRNPSTSCW